MALGDLRERAASYASSAFASFRGLTVATAAANVTTGANLARRLRQLFDLAAPLIELRDDDVPAQQAMQRDATLWADESDARWLRQLQERLPEAQVKASPDALRVHVMTRALHFPAYVIGQLDYMRMQYEATNPEAGAFPDLLPPDLAISGIVRSAYEQVLLCRALGINMANLGDTHLAAAKRLAAADAAALRRTISDALAPRLNAAGDVARDLRTLSDGNTFTQIERGILETLVRRYDALI
jgi:hypothetical protein